MVFFAAARESVSPAKVDEMKYSPQFMISFLPATQDMGMPFAMAFPRQIISGSMP